MTTVGEVMSTDLVAVEPSITVADAATLMSQRRVGSVLVMEGDRLAGIFTERDVLEAIAEAHAAGGQRVGECMTHDPITITPDADVRHALRIMLDKGFRHLPVVDGDPVVGPVVGRVVGMVSLRGLSGALGP